MLSDFSYEDDVKCLSIIPGKVKNFQKFVKVPQIGWNKVNFVKESPLLDDIPNESYFYFVNSFYFETDRDFLTAESDYGITFPSIIQKDNFYATQFHPEKSGKIGAKLLFNFVKMLIIPAIDIIEGTCVRLEKGDYRTKKTYSKTLLKVAKNFEYKGAEICAHS